MRFARFMLATLVFSISVLALPVTAAAFEPGPAGGHHSGSGHRSVPELGLTGAAAAAAVVVGGSLVVFGVRRKKRD